MKNKETNLIKFVKAYLDMARKAFPKRAKTKISFIKVTILVDLSSQILMDIHMTATRRHHTKVAPSILMMRNLKKFISSNILWQKPLKCCFAYSLKTYDLNKEVRDEDAVGKRSNCAKRTTCLGVAG